MTTSTDSPALRTNVAPARTEFFGRDDELAQMEAAFPSGGGLVTIVGPPGAGKTRLAKEFARRVIERGDADAVWFFDLSPTSRLADAVVRVADVLDVPLSRSVDGSITAIIDVLRAMKRSVLVFDNFEQLADVEGALADSWVMALPQARFVVTSQIRIGTPTEVCVELGSLGDAAATALFEERARAVRHGFRLDAGADSIELLLDQLDRLPLAIELAAARTNAFGVEDMLARMSRRFEILERGGVTDRGRHATLEAAISWSWELLEPDEQIALECCALFDRGFWIAAAESVVRDVAPDADVARSVTRLRERSLLFAVEVPQAKGRLRLRLYESIREYARQRLEEGPRRDDAVAAYVAYYAERSKSWLGEARYADAAAVADIFSDRENLVHAAHIALTRDPDDAVALTTCIQDLNDRRGPLDQNADLVETLAKTLADAGLPEDSLPRLHVAHLIGRLRHAQARIEDGKKILARAVELATPKGEHWLVARCAFALGSLDHALGDVPAALDSFERAAESATAINDEFFRSQATERIGAMHTIRGDFEAARTALEDAIRAQAGGKFGDEEAFTRMTFVNLCVGLGYLSEAGAHAEKAVALYQRVGNTRGEAEALTLAALVAIEQGRLEDGEGFVEAALVLHRRVAYRQSLGTACLFRGMLRQEQGDLDGAEADLREAFELHRTSYSRPTAFDRCQLGLVLLERGDAVGAESELERGVETLRSIGDHVFAGRFARALVIARYLRGRAAQASEEWDRAREEAPAEGEPVVASLDSAATAVAAVAAARRAHVERRTGDVGPDLADARAALRAIDDEAPASASFVRAVVRIAERAITRAEALVVEDQAGVSAKRVGHRSPNVLRVAEDSSWFEFASLDRVHIARRTSLRGILGALVRKRLDAPGIGMSRVEVFAAGWPGEQVLEEAARSRVYVAIRTLRTLGLADVLDTGGQGYLIRPAVEVEVV